MKRLRKPDPRSRENSREPHAKLSDPINTNSGGGSSAVGGAFARGGALVVRG